jgi:hypothetical protein
MIEFTIVGEIVRDLAVRGEAVRPRDITDLFYKRLLPGERCPVVGGRRLIPRDLVPAIEAELRERGLIAGTAREGAV